MRRAVTNLPYLKLSTHLKANLEINVRTHLYENNERHVISITCNGRHALRSNMTLHVVRLLIPVIWP
jgi:hypothetical protein